MQDQHFKTLARGSSVALMSLYVMSACAVEQGSVVSSAQAQTPTSSPSPATQPSNDRSQQIWGCRAQDGKRTYVVDQLSHNANNFDMAIYEGGEDAANYVGTAQVNVTQKDPELIGRGQTFNSTLEVNALGRTAAFTVRDSVAGQASGRCSIQWQMADNRTRRLVRQCLAFAERKSGFLAEVQRNACVTDPSSALEELQR